MTIVVDNRPAYGDSCHSYNLPPFMAFCDERRLRPDRLPIDWGVKEVTQDGRAALVYPTPIGVQRIKYLDNQKPKYRWLRGGGRAHWYGLEQALDLNDPIYLVNGEPSVWACQQEGVAAICLCSGEGTPPKPELVKELQDYGIDSVRIAYDKDAAGSAGARKACEVLRAGGIKAVIVQLPPELAEGGDVDDLHRIHGAKLGEVLDGLPRIRERPSRILSISELETLPEPRQIIEGVLTSGGLGVLFGAPGVGKTI